MTGRAATIGRLAGELATLAADGDLEGARLVQETIARLLAPRPAEHVTGATVIDLEAERERRAGRP